MNRLSKILTSVSIFLSLVLVSSIIYIVKLNNVIDEIEKANYTAILNIRDIENYYEELKKDNEELEKENKKLQEKNEALMNNTEKDELIESLNTKLDETQKELENIRKENDNLKEQMVEVSQQEQARNELIEKHGRDVVEAWEKLSRDEFFDYLGYTLTIEENTGPEGIIYYKCYKVMKDGTMEDAYVGGEYYIYGVYMSNEAFFDLVDYHNTFFTTTK